ncbi:MAG: sulfurtransferase complex subunit TusB [Pseudomonadales bacterium]|nr:sulfurtransferase complex subunit TusB [Pseudomonadales bacterium]
MLLHTINKSPFVHLSFQSLLSFCDSSDAIVLIEDGVLSIKHPIIEKVKGIPIYALETDIQARGLSASYENQSKINAISYAQFVQLCTEYPKQKNW